MTGVSSSRLDLSTGWRAGEFSWAANGGLRASVIPTRTLAMLAMPAA
jgi:hypothetical protein